MPGAVGHQVGVPPAAVRRIEHPLHDLRVAARSAEVLHQQGQRPRNDGRREAGAGHIDGDVAVSRAGRVGRERPHGARRREAVMRPESRGVPIRRKRAAAVGIGGDGARFRIRRGDGQGMPAQRRYPIGQVRSQAGPGRSFIAGGIDEDGFLGVGSVGLQDGIQIFRQIPPIPSEFGLDLPGGHVRIENRASVGSVDDVELGVFIAAGASHLIVEACAIRIRQRDDHRSQHAVCESVRPLIVRKVLRDRDDRRFRRDAAIRSGRDRGDLGPVRS